MNPFCSPLIFPNFQNFADYTSYHCPLYKLLHQQVFRTCSLLQLDFLREEYGLLSYQYTHLLPTILKHSLIVGYADTHSLLKITSIKQQIKFAPNKVSYY